MVNKTVRYIMTIQQECSVTINKTVLIFESISTYKVMLNIGYLIFILVTDKDEQLQQNSNRGSQGKRYWMKYVTVLVKNLAKYI